MTDESGKHVETLAIEARRRTSAASILYSLREAHTSLMRSLELLLNDELASPRELIDQIGFESLDRYLPVHVRAKVLEAALAAGRTGVPFDDDALLKVVSVELLVRSLPFERLRDVVELLCSRVDLTPLVDVVEHTAPLKQNVAARSFAPPAPTAPQATPRRRTTPPPLPSASEMGAPFPASGARTEAARAAGRPPPLPSTGRLSPVPTPPPLPVTPPPLPMISPTSGRTDTDIMGGTVRVANRAGDDLEALDDGDLAAESTSPPPSLRSTREPGSSRRGRLGLAPPSESLAMFSDSDMIDEPPVPTRRSTRPAARQPAVSSEPERKGPPSRSPRTRG